LDKLKNDLFNKSIKLKNMKKDFKLFGLLLVFAVVFVSTSCDDDDD